MTITTTDFTPAGATEAGEHDYTLTADANGNAYLYGTFAASGSVEVQDKDGNVLAKYDFADPTESGKSYVLDVTGTNTTP